MMSAMSAQKVASANIRPTPSSRRRRRGRCLHATSCRRSAPRSTASVASAAMPPTSPSAFDLMSPMRRSAAAIFSDRALSDWARFASDALEAAVRACSAMPKALSRAAVERLLVGGDRVVRLLLQTLCVVEIAGDAVAAHLEDAADARQRDLLHQPVKERRSVIASQKSCEAKNSGLNGGNTLLFAPPASSAPVFRLATRRGRLGCHDARSASTQVNRRMRATRNEKMPRASVTAKPKIRLVN